MKTTMKQVLHWLERFRTVADVAGACRELGIRGIPFDHYRCGVARLIQKQFRDTEPFVQPGKCAMMSFFSISTGRMVDTDFLPASVNRFANAFDDGKYPDLVTEN